MNDDTWYVQGMTGSDGSHRDVPDMPATTKQLSDANSYVPSSADLNRGRVWDGARVDTNTARSVSDVSERATSSRTEPADG
jgi:hypothetical protein